MFDDLDTDCDCGGTIRFSLDDLARERTVRCSRGCSVKLQDEGGGAAKAARSTRELERSLKQLGGTFKF